MSREVRHSLGDSACQAGASSLSSQAGSSATHLLKEASETPVPSDDLIHVDSEVDGSAGDRQYNKWYSDKAYYYEEIREAANGRGYTLQEFYAWYGEDKFMHHWTEAGMRSGDKRRASNGKLYTLQEFFAHYGKKTFEYHWRNAREDGSEPPTKKRTLLVHCQVQSESSSEAIDLDPQPQRSGDLTAALSQMSIEEPDPEF